jgi:tetratricopeptide (TPR) repeat protein
MMDWDERLEWGKQLISQGLFHAALDVLRDLERSFHPSKPVWIAELYNELGKVYIFLPDYREAVNQFTKAISYARDREGLVKYHVNMAYAYRRLSEFDTAYRYLSHAYELLDLDMSPEVQGGLFLNLSAIHGINGFYEQAIDYARKSLAAYSTADIHHYDAHIYSNLGLAYREMNNYDKAEECLNTAIELYGDSCIDVFAELGRVYWLRGEIHQSLECAQHALRIVWASLINYEKEDLANLCHFLSNISLQANEPQLAFRLAEKAQVFYGQIGMWRQWRDLYAEITNWMDIPSQCNINVDSSTISFAEIHQFLNCLDAVNSQELIHKKFANILDMRVHYTKLLANALGLTDQDQNDLVLASRFADYGLTALENEVALNPRRSPQAFEKYKQHPSLSVRMLRTLHLPERIENIVADHHENYDGTGFPYGKQQGEINYLARVLSVAGRYTFLVVGNEMRHSDAIKEIAGQSGHAFDPSIVDVFRKLFEINGMPD